MKHIYEELKSLYVDVRAEVLVAEILENTPTDISDFTVSHKSTFTRTYRRDVIDYQYNLSKFDEYVLTINLSRSGIYDTLPEGVFHYAGDPKQKALSHQKKRELQKKEERDARQFFQPIENEFFVQQVAIEQKERQLHNRFASIQNNFLFDFWQIEGFIPKSLAIKLIKLLPHAHAILGDMESTALCLEKIIDEKVNLEKGWSDEARFRESINGETLGVDFVLTSEIATILSPSVTVEIGPVSRKNAHRYVEGHPYRLFLDVFYSYFIPMEMDIVTNVEIERENLTFTLHDHEPALMGLTTVL